MTDRWDELGQVPLEDLVEPRIQLHYAAQLLTSLSGLAEPEPDASHRSLAYDSRSSVLGAQPVHASRVLRPGLHVPSLTLVFEVDGDQRADLALDGVSFPEALAWMTYVVRRTGVPTDAMGVKAYGDDFPAHPIAEGEAFAVDAPALAELDGWLAGGWSLLEALSSGYPSALSVRTWPHHLDSAFLMQVGPGEEPGAKTVGVGLSLGDIEHPAPYVYVSAWPSPPASSLPSSDGPGAWQAEPWFGARFDAEVILAAAERRELVASLAIGAIETNRALLGA